MVSMCGRFVSKSPPSLMAERFDVIETAVEHAPNYNVSPRSKIYVVRQHPEGPRQLDLLRWGLIPKWAKDVKIGDRMINARAETLLEKPAFRALVAKQRCVIPVDGFYEWKRDGKVKQPMLIRRLDGAPLAFAGLWSVWRDPENDDAVVASCAIITTAATGAITQTHHRMPMMLEQGAWQQWLAVQCTDSQEAYSAMVPINVDELDVFPVSTLVNKPTNNGPELMDRIALA